jgi:hypothetical protein
MGWRGMVEMATGAHWALSVDCPYCQAGAGHPCIDQRNTSRRLRSPHRERRAAAIVVTRSRPPQPKDTRGGG